MIVSTAELFKTAYGKFAVGAYNINNMEQALGLFQGILTRRRPSSSKFPKARVNMQA